MKKQLTYLLVILVSVWLAPQPVFSVEAKKKTLVIHAKTSLEIDSGQLSTVPNVVWTGLEEGFKVVILFDASGVTAIKKGGSILGLFYTPLDDVDLAPQVRNALAEQMNLPVSQIPRNYGEYIRFLKGKKGVALYVNRVMLLHYKINEDEIDSAVTPITLQDMIKLLNEAAVYLAY